MTWRLLNADEVEITPVFSFRMEQSRSKPATLSWTMPVSEKLNTDKVTLWQDEVCVFQGFVHEVQTHIQGNIASWFAVAIDSTFHAQLESLIEELNAASPLEGTVKDCVGGRAGYVHIDPVTHRVKWVPLDSPIQIWDTQGLHESDSIYITPIDSTLTGVSASVKVIRQREERGMMDVGPYITAILGHGVETYSGLALESEWTHLAFRALRAGYDIQRAALVPLTYQRADLPKVLSVKEHHDKIIGIPYQAYKVELLLSWALPVTTQTTTVLSTGSACEMLTLTPKTSEIEQETILKESLKWIQAYACVRSFTSQMKAKILLSKDLSIAKLSTQSWGCIKDLRINDTPIQGPIISYAIIHDGNDAWIEFSQLWAPKDPLSIPKLFHADRSEGKPIVGPKIPEEVIANVNVINNALEQYAYYVPNKAKIFEDFSIEFPMTQLDIAIHPPITGSIEYLEEYYRLSDS